MASASALLGSYFFAMVLSFCDVRSVWAFEASIVAFAVIGGIVGTVMDYTILYGTSFIGSYLVVRGLSFIFGGYPSEV